MGAPTFASSHAAARLGPGCDYVHVYVDDHSRVGFAQIYPDESGASVTDFLQAVRV